MKDWNLCIANEILFPDNAIKKEYLKILKIKNLQHYSKSFKDIDKILIEFYQKNISNYNLNDRKKIVGSFFKCRRNGYVTNYDSIMINDILYASIFCMFYNFILMNLISKKIFSKYRNYNKSTSLKIYFGLLAFGLIPVSLYGYNKFKENIQILDRKYYPISRFLDYKKLGIDYTIQQFIYQSEISRLYLYFQSFSILYILLLKKEKIF